MALPSLLRTHRRSVLVAAACAAAVLGVASALLALFDGGEEHPAVLAASVPQAIVADFGEGQDSIRAVRVDAPADASAFATIPHAEGWGIIGSVSPDGAWLAYTVLPEGARSPQHEAEAHLLSLTGDGDHRVATGVDLQVRPVWAQDSSRVAFVRGAPTEDEGTGSFAVLVAGTSGEAREVGTIADAFAVFPIGFEDDAVFVAVTDVMGTRLERVPGGPVSDVPPLSDGIARDFALSPDGTRLAYVDLGSSSEAVGAQVRVVSLEGGLVSAETQGIATVEGPTLGPAWTPSGELTLATPSIPVPLVAASELRAAQLPAPATDGPRFDIPLAWSPDGSTLAVQAVTGTLEEVEDLDLDLVGPGDARASVGDADTKLLGWVPPAAEASD